MSKVVVVDYGIGNIFSVCSSIEEIGHQPILTRDRKEILDSGSLVLPGVGSFDKAMNELRRFELDSILEEYIKKGNPFLGICVGMQAMMSHGDEGNGAEGLGFIKGEVKRIDTSFQGTLIESKKRLPIPHIAWSKVQLNGKQSRCYEIFMKKNSYMYFVHSYHCIPEAENEISSYANYENLKITASIQKDNLTGVQFHPERSGPAGLEFLKDFFDQK